MLPDRLKQNRTEGFQTLGKWILTAALSLVLAIVTDRILLVLIGKAVHVAGIAKLIRYFEAVQYFSYKRIYFFFVIIWFFLIVYRKGTDWAVRRRYVLTFFLLWMLVLGKFSGSSLDGFDGMLAGNTPEHEKMNILGYAQGIRADEWAIEKPYYFAQVSGNQDAPYYNDNLMINGADMVVMGFAPVKDLMILARPALWGFLFLPVEYAFSYYWNIRLLLLFLGAFEFGRLLLKNERISILAAISLVFAGPVQWWLSQMSIDMMYAGMYAVVSWVSLITNEKMYKKMICACGLAFWGNVYIYVMYPAQQIPFGYLFLTVVLYLGWKNREKKPFGNRKNIVCYFFVAVWTAAMAVHFIQKSGPAVQIMTNTVYPGTKRSWGNYDWDYELLKFINLFTSSYKDSSYLNNCEISQFIYFLPFLLIILFLLIKKRKGREEVLCAGTLFATSFVLWIFTKLPNETMISNLLFGGMTYPRRIYLAAGFGFFWVLWILVGCSCRLNETLLQETNRSKFVNLIIYVIIIFSVCSPNLGQYFMDSMFIPGMAVLIVCVIMYGKLGDLLLRGKASYVKRFAILYTVISVMQTILINPLASGLDAVYEKKSLEQVRQIAADDPDGRWMISGNAGIGNLVSMQGVKRCSGYYYYPDIDMMKIIDPEEKYIDLWNAFTALDMRLTEGENYVESPDWIPSLIVYVNLETARKLNIHYIFTTMEEPESYIETGILQKLYEDEQDNAKIYQIHYETDREAV